MAQAPREGQDEYWQVHESKVAWNSIRMGSRFRAIGRVMMISCRKIWPVVGINGGWRCDWSGLDVEWDSDNDAKNDRLRVFD